MFDASALREREFARLDATGAIYLDYTGSALAPASLIARDAQRLTTQIFGNPHSESAPSRRSTESVAAARSLTLRFLDADPAEYDVVFTANASAALRILAESFPFRAGSRLVLSADNHNSVNGLRVRAHRRGATVEYVPLDRDLRGRDPRPWLARPEQPSLLAFAAQSNFSGVQHPLEWIGWAQQQGYRVALDAAAFAPYNSLSLRAAPADFVALSFYKMFGYPTGLGALVARREALAGLRRQYFSGGTVQFVSVQNRRARLKDDGERFEDGTANFLAMPAVCDGLNWLESLGMPEIHRHVERMTAELLRRLADLGGRMIVYGPRAGDGARGGVVTFNLVRDGSVIPFEVVEEAARERGIAIRGGCFCNPGAAEHAFALPAAGALECLHGAFSIPRFRDCVDGRAVGALRASVGIATIGKDVDALWELVVGLTDRRSLPDRSIARRTVAHREALALQPQLPQSDECDLCSED